MKDLSKYLYALLAWLVFIIPARADIGLRITYETGTIGDIVSVPIYVDTSLTSLNILSYQVSVDYNASLLEALDPEFAGTMSIGWGMPVYNVSQPGKVSVSHAGINPLTGTGVLVYMRFRLKAQGYSNLNFNSGETLFNEGDIPLYLTNGRISISPKPYLNFSPNGALLAVGETLQYYVSNGTAPYTWTTTDTDVASISASGLVLAKTPGKVRVIATDAGMVTDTANAFVEVVPFKMTIRDTSYYQNNQVTIPVNISELDSYNVLSGEVDISFNSTVLKAIEVIFDGSILEGLNNVSANMSVEGEVKISFASITSLQGSGPLFFIRFQVEDRSSGSTQISIHDARFNELLKAKVDNGNFSIIALPKLNVSPKTGELFIGETLDFNVSGGIEPYTWKVSNSSLASINSDGLLMALSGGQVTVSVSDVRGSFGESGIVELYDGMIELGNISVPADESLGQLPVYLNSDNNIFPIISLSGVIDFDEARIDGIDVNNIGTATQSWSFSQSSNNNHFQFAGAGITGVTGDATMLQLDVTIKNGLAVGLKIPMTFSELEINEGHPRLKVIGGSVQVGEPTDIDDLDGQGVKVIYEMGVLRLINIPSDCHAISVYNLAGQRVYQAVNKENELKLHRGTFKSGIYIVELDTHPGQFLKIKF